ncbi:BTAD domain-containing putative transcriptional regulator [Saccharothrix sp. NPDC042600]|uniref:BTAD domain-containing putative transcriptional regulator n=1 Tax=Saccharothrix TaxID=2071 RepID=UPI0033EA737C|nr:BTAD domain-containing putative transcriptional regulator [Saccharothrix mutabilis subsp. capreolus]
MRFGVLGPLAVWTADGTPVRVPEAKVRALLARLLVAEGRPVPVDALGAALWGAHPPGNPGNTLQTKVSALRKALGRDVVVWQPPGYAVRYSWLDLVEFRALAAAGAHDDALALWRGEPLAEFGSEPFAVGFAARVAEERLTVVEDRAQALLAAGRPVSLAEEVARHPLRERLRGLHMRSLYLGGHQVRALESYAAYRRLLAEEQGLAPGPELVELHQALLRHEVVRPRTNLPAPVTSLVGRSGAVAAVAGLLGSARLVTLTGPGGVGKTSLAVEVARSLEGAVADGVWLVELAGLDRVAGERVAGAVAAVVGVREEVSPGMSAQLVDRVAEAFRGREVLLVLDNCERLVGAVAGLVSRLLRAAPGLRVLATSQEPLGIAGETVWVVPPLEPPDAVRLFGERASAAVPGFAVTADNRAVVERICARLDGLPLALELAATRVRALGVDGLLERLDDRFRVLSGGPRDAPERQRTLRAMIDWSWDLLEPAERAVLRRLAVVVEGCDLEAAEAICAGDGVDDVLEGLSRLVDRSLVVVVPGDRVRYRLLESVADYGRERLVEAGEQAAVRARHAAHYRALAERADPELRGPDQLRWLARLDADAANLRAAVEGDPGAARALAWYWFLRGRVREARDALDGPWRQGFSVLAGGPVRDPGHVADPRARWFLGYVFSTVGDMAAGERLTDSALAEFVARGDEWGVAAALSDRFSQAMGRGDFDTARDAAERADRAFTALGDRWGRLQASFALGTLAQLRGDYDTAARVHRRGLELARELRSWPEVSYTLSWLGRVALLTGDFAESGALHEQARRIAADQGFSPGEMYAETGLALVARRSGDLAEADRLLARLREWHRRPGFEAGATLVLAEQGFVAEQRGDVEEALRLQRAGLDLARRVGDPRAVALACEGLAGAEALAGRHEEAARLLGVATAHRLSVGVPLPDGERHDVDRITAAARAALGDERFRLAFKEGSEDLHRADG